MHSNISILEPVDKAAASELVKVMQEMALQGAAGYFKGFSMWALMLEAEAWEQFRRWNRASTWLEWCLNTFKSKRIHNYGRMGRKRI